jgi:hypothetical protein
MIDTVAEAPASPEHILQTGLAFWVSKTLLSAVELELFTKLAAQSGLDGRGNQMNR